MSALLWRARLGKLPTLDRINRRGANTAGQCLLCDQGQESRAWGHLFYQCAYSKWILSEALNAAGGLIDENASELKEILEQVEGRITKESRSWGLHWTILAIVTWRIWREHNQRLKKGTRRPKESIVREYINTTELGKRESKFRKVYRTAKELLAMNQWDALILLLHG